MSELHAKTSLRELQVLLWCLVMDAGAFCSGRIAPREEKKKKIQQQMCYSLCLLLTLVLGLRHTPAHK